MIPSFLCIQIIEKLSPQPPKRATVDAKMKQIAAKYDVDWDPADDVNEEDMPAIVGHRNEVCYFANPRLSTISSPYFEGLKIMRFPIQNLINSKIRFIKTFLGVF